MYECSMQDNCDAHAIKPNTPRNLKGSYGSEQLVVQVYVAMSDVL